MTGEILTVSEVAELLRVGRNAVYDLAARNKIPHVRIGRLLRFNREAVVRWSASWSAQVAEEG